jgi:hypothetical protein
MRLFGNPFKRLNSAAFIKVDDRIELLRERCLKVVAR